ncbi:MAG: MBOAT family protein [Oscillospiraceae bacterium]|nr:MBOAT family protein [Oscillospiraceae bacterium]
MVFSSALFLFAFLPVLYAIYRLTPGIKGKNIVLLIFSLISYAFGDIAYLPLLLASIVINWGAGRLLGAMTPKNKGRYAVLFLTVALDLGLMAVFKYLDFIVGNINALLGLSIPLPGIALPLGISFFTFTALSYVIEVYRKPKNMERNLLKTGLYICLFPTILSGPIVSYKSFAPQTESRTCTPEKTAAGLRRFMYGMAKKLLIADTVGAMVDAIYAGSVLDARIAWLGAVGYAVQILFDFSGYTDMALGLGKMFGFDFPENFDRPYTALGMTDFWRRWHISLTTWFRNYLYMPLVMSKPLQRLYKKWAAKYGRPKANKLSVLIPTTVVWLLTGLWHGADWSYVLWGLWHGLFCLLEGVGILRTKRLEESVPGRVVLHVYTWLVVLLGTVLFRSESMAQAGQMLAAMFTGWRFTALGTLELQQMLTGLCVFCLIFGIAASTVKAPKLKDRLLAAKWTEPVSYVVCGGLFVLCVMSMAQSGFQPFIYQQF